MTTPLNVRKLAMRAFAVSCKGSQPAPGDRQKLLNAVHRVSVEEINQAGAAAALLRAVCDYYCQRGPLVGVPGMLGQAVRLCTDEWAANAQDGTPESDPTFWYQEGGME